MDIKELRKQYKNLIEEAYSYILKSEWDEVKNVYGQIIEQIKDSEASCDEKELKLQVIGIVCGQFWDKMKKAWKNFCESSKSYNGGTNIMDYHAEFEKQKTNACEFFFQDAKAIGEYINSLGLEDKDFWSFEIVTVQKLTELIKGAKFEEDFKKSQVEYMGGIIISEEARGLYVLQNEISVYYVTEMCQFIRMNPKFALVFEDLLPLLEFSITKIDKVLSLAEAPTRYGSVMDVSQTRGIDTVKWQKYKNSIESDIEWSKKMISQKVVDRHDDDEPRNGCYVATCVYGSYDCPEVWTLRRFRDYTLDKTWYGRLFIKTYYAISPTAVKLFGRYKWFKNLFKAPLNNMVNKLKEEGYQDTPYSDKY